MLEAVPAKLAALVTKEVGVPTIGIGAGPECDGQVLVWQDMLGITERLSPKFVKRFAPVGDAMREAFAVYANEVRAGTFPGPEHGYGMDEDILNTLY